MIKSLGYGTAIIHYEGHVMVGLKCSDSVTGTYFEKDGARYYVVETTGEGWKLGELPNEYKGQPATVYVVKQCILSEKQELNFNALTSEILRKQTINDKICSINAQ